MSVLAFDAIVAAVIDGLASLPGVEAQLRMAPQPRGGWKPGFAPDAARIAAALLLLFPASGRAAVLLTKRASALPNHAGQVSLPGGAVNPGESIEGAALREAEEEVGLVRADVRVIGRLTPLQQAFIDCAAFQCGFCTSGMLMAATALLEETPQPTAEQVEEGLEGNLCRCTGYAPIVEAVLKAAEVAR